MRFLSKTNLPFVKIRYYAYAFSAIILIAGIIGLVTNGLNWSIDFTSGVAMELNLTPANPSTPALQIEDLRKVLSDNGFKEAEIQRIGTPEAAHFLIKSKIMEDNADKSTRERITDIITQNLPAYTEGRDLEKDVIVQSDEVGPKVGDELRSQALLAVLLSMFLMIIYIWIRFELTFGISAILAILHDVLIIVGIFAITGKEITIQIVAALLTIVGYSINDTIVIYDRIREDLRTYRKDPYETVFNNAMNKTLSRTVITAGTTMLTALALYFFGGTVIHDFAFAMVLGLIFGTYSSIFVASNLVIDYYHLTHHDKASLQTLTSKSQTKRR
ncbi:MAG: protein translocase subunit SecF [Candidatus Cloacimonadaceae bacterium]